MSFHVHCRVADLRTALTIVNQAVAKRSALPILSHVHLEASEDKQLLLTGTNLEIMLSSRITADVRVAGSITLQASHLSKELETLPQKELITLEQEVNGTTILLTCTHTTTRLQGMPESEFPARITYDSSAKDRFDVQGKTLKQASSLVSFVSSKDVTRPVFTGVLLKPEESGIAFVAADRFRLAVYREKAHCIPGFPPTLLPATSLVTLASLIGVDEVVRCSADPEHNRFLAECGPLLFASRTIEGTFPIYEYVMPKEFATVVTLQTEPLAQAYKGLEWLAKESANRVMVTISPNGEQGEFTTALSASATDCGNKTIDLGQAAKAKVSEQSTEQKVCFNLAYMREVLEQLKKHHVEWVELCLNAKGPSLLRPGNGRRELFDYTYLLMPIETRN